MSTHTLPSHALARSAGPAEYTSVAYARRNHHRGVLRKGLVENWSPIGIAPEQVHTSGDNPGDLLLSSDSAENEVGKFESFEGMVGNSSALRRTLQQLVTVAPTDATVLIQGETGTGKELIARAVHNLSSRRDRQFVRFNCAAIPLGLLRVEETW
jgi:transcriptional regulator with PAS, ATPase and Fis domain